MRETSKICVLFCTLIITCAKASWAEEYLCTADQSVGFSFIPSERSWASTDLPVAEKQYILRPMTKDEREQFDFESEDAVWFLPVGQKRPEVACSSPLSQHMACSFAGRQLTFSAEDLQYTLSFTASYYTPEFAFGYPMYLEIGRCSVLN